MRQRILSSLLFCLLTVSCSTFSVSAQTQGEITGVITDVSGAVVAGALITVTNSATSAARNTVSNDSGIGVVARIENLR